MLRSADGVAHRVEVAALQDHRLLDAAGLARAVLAGPGDESAAHPVLHRSATVGVDRLAVDGLLLQRAEGVHRRLADVAEQGLDRVALVLRALGLEVQPPDQRGQGEPEQHERDQRDQERREHDRRAVRRTGRDGLGRGDRDDAAHPGPGDGDDAAAGDRLALLEVDVGAAAGEPVAGPGEPRSPRARSRRPSTSSFSSNWSSRARICSSLLAAGPTGRRSAGPARPRNRRRDQQRRRPAATSPVISPMWSRPGRRRRGPGAGSPSQGRPRSRG